MKYTEPSIATRLKELNAQRVTDIVLVRIFFTVSSHSFDGIPTIIGQKDNLHSREHIQLERIERYTPRARVHLTPLLDFRSARRRSRRPLPKRAWR
jgi:sirohydrochlorin ferrochelatase